MMPILKCRENTTFKRKNKTNIKLQSYENVLELSTNLSNLVFELHVQKKHI